MWYIEDELLIWSAHGGLQVFAKLVNTKKTPCCLLCPLCLLRKKP
uniref:Uncharacterized protein n=1 Tax=Myoviridae sp. ctj994 TaxID=2825160 RepID=A0A8S5NXW9_9CAUD|nr:MAG TPA: hypothetical protein [Myoviridae sp. ctj994]